MSLPRYDVERHLPLITPRIEFRLSPRLPLPVVTPRLEFQLDEGNTLRSASSGTEPHAGAISQPPTLPSTSAFTPSSPATDPLSQRLIALVAANAAARASAPPSASASASAPTTSAIRSTAPSSQMVPKPNGEPGRPKSGGFNLESTLMDVHGWSQQDVNDLMAFLRTQGPRVLNMNVSFRAQKKGIVDALCNKAMEDANFPGLRGYDNCWPVRSAVKLILKYRSEASRRNDGRNTAQRIRNALEGDSRSSSEE